MYYCSKYDWRSHVTVEFFYHQSCYSRNDPSRKWCHGSPISKSDGLRNVSNRCSAYFKEKSCPCSELWVFGIVGKKNKVFDEYWNDSFTTTLLLVFFSTLNWMRRVDDESRFINWVVWERKYFWQNYVYSWLWSWRSDYSMTEEIIEKYFIYIENLISWYHLE